MHNFPTFFLKKYRYLPSTVLTSLAPADFGGTFRCWLAPLAPALLRRGVLPPALFAPP